MVFCIAFLKQYADSGVGLPVVGPAFSFDQGILQAVGEAAMGVKNTSQWSKDLDNAANQAFVAAFDGIDTAYWSIGKSGPAFYYNITGNRSRNDSPTGSRRPARGAGWPRRRSPGC